jgi:hypothetical protein
MIKKPKKLQLSLTLQFTFFFILVAGFIYYYFSQKFEDEVLDRFKFKSEVITKYLEQNPQIFWTKEIEYKSQLIQLMILNDAKYFVLEDNDGELIDAINFDIAEYYSYVKANHTNNISFDKSVYRVLIPLNDNHIKKGKVYLGFDAGMVIVDLKRKTLLTALFSFPQ